MNRKTLIFIRNMKNKLKGKDHRFGFSSEFDLYYVNEERIRQYFANWNRGITLYRSGVAARGRLLSESYMLDRLDWENDDVVIDCGTNYADLWIYLKERINPENYHTFEPGEGKYSSIVRNVPGANHNNIGLGNRNGTVTFYINDEDADSSVIQPSSYFDTAEVEISTLDSYVEKRGITSIKLLKLEAEGYEPEVMEGAESSLRLVDYVAIDGGNERGVDAKETFSWQVNFLTSRRFEMLEVNFKWGRALFKRKDIS